MNNSKASFLIRSKLFVPATRQDFYEKALNSQADAICFDFEASVVTAQKPLARLTLSKFLATDFKTSKTLMVRVNPVSSENFMLDFKVALHPKINIINLPLVNNVHEVKKAAQLVRDNAPHIRLLINIETAQALRLAADLATSDDLVCGLQLGYADLFKSCRINRRQLDALSYIRLQTRLAASEANIEAYDGAWPYIKDLEGYRTECQHARDLGFAGKSCIHPTQITTANEVFLPTSEEIASAMAIIEKAKEAEKSGLGASSVNGQMIDEPFIQAAYQTLEWAKQISDK